MARIAASGKGFTNVPKMDMLESGIAERQDELQKVAGILASSAERHRRFAGWIRVLLIFLGAIAATQSAWDQMLTNYRDYSFLIFTLIGVLITTLAGLEAAFKFEARGAELNLLAASCHSTVRKTDAAWYKQVLIATDQKAQVDGAMTLMELQDAMLSEIQEKATASGVNITLEVRNWQMDGKPRSADMEKSTEPPYSTAA